MLSRGAFVRNLVQSTSWFEGPDFLKGLDITVPGNYEAPAEVPEKRPIRTAFMATTCLKYINLIGHINHRNSFEFLQKLIAYIFRFFNNCRCPKDARKVGELSILELETGLMGLVKNVQRNVFSKQYDNLRNNKPLESKEAISSLSIYIDNNSEILRVGGRLKNSRLPADSKHQILLPGNHLFSKLLLSHLHKRYMHVAPQGLVAISRERYWIVNAKRMAKNIVFNCIRCFKTRPRSIHQLMGQLPEERVTPSRPFSIVGIDFCGPIMIHHCIRGKRPTKAYVSIFICFATRAIHIELVSDLTTAAFLNALKRFIARRGVCAKIYSDNATNFVGARSELHELNKLHQSQQFKQGLTTFCQLEQIEWHHIPPRAPHFGGLWEAAVKSAKYHLIRFTANALLTAEELQTVLAQIEAILNSRPITPMSSDPNDLEALTPGHFLIGGPLISIAEPNISDQKFNCLSRFRKIQLIHQQFWRRWSTEYLNLLQSKNIWRTIQEPINRGDLVLIKDSNQPPLKWKLGRVISTVPGKDELIRVASVRTETGVLKRAIHQLCPLPKAEKGPEDVESVAQPIIAKRRVFKKGVCNILSMALISLLCIICPTYSMSEGQSENVLITQFESNIGMYFENIGDIKTVTSKWDIVIYYNLTTYWQELEGLQDYYSTLAHLCDKSTDTPCSMFARELLHRLHVIDHNNALLHKINFQKPSRSKRSPFDIVGSLANGLFGVLDQNYANKMEKEIQRINKNEKNLLQFIKNQTSIADSTINLFKKSAADIQRQFSVTQKQLTAIIKDSQRTHVDQYVNTLSNYVIVILTNYENTQRGLLDVLLDLHHHKINPQLITPDQLQVQLSMIRANIPSSLTLPTTDLLELYKIVSVKTRIVENAIIFKIELPLTANEYFQLFHVVPVPILKNKASFLARTSSKYLAVTLLRDKYFPISENELRFCSHLTTSSYLCREGHTILNLESKNSNCMISLLLNKRELLTECQLVQTNETLTWIKLVAANTWIFSLNDEHAETADLICDGRITVLSLEGSGLLSLRSPCILRFKFMTIYSEVMSTTSMQLSFRPSNLSIWNIPRQIDDFTNIIPGLSNSTIDNVSTHIKNLQILEEAADLNIHDIHHYGISYLTILIIIILLAMYFWNKRRSQRPIPLPRSTTQPSIFRVSSSL